MSKRELETLGKMGSRLSLRFMTAVDGSEMACSALSVVSMKIYSTATVKTAQNGEYGAF